MQYVIITVELIPTYNASDMNLEFNSTTSTVVSINLTLLFLVVRVMIGLHHYPWSIILAIIKLASLVT